MTLRRPKKSFTQFLKEQKAKNFEALLAELDEDEIGECYQVVKRRKMPDRCNTYVYLPPDWIARLEGKRYTRVWTGTKEEYLNWYDEMRDRFE